MFRFTFTRGVSGTLDSYECVYVDAAGRDTTTTTTDDTIAKAEDLAKVKIGIFNAVPSNFSAPVTSLFNGDISASNTQSSTSGNDWGWYTRSYQLSPLKPVSKSDLVLEALGDGHASLGSAANAFGQQQHPPYIGQSMYPLIADVAMYNQIEELTVTQWRLGVASKVCV